MRLILLTLILSSAYFVNAQTNILFSKSSGALNSGGTLDLMMYNPIDKSTSLLLKGTVNRRGEYNAITSPDGTKIIFNTYRFSGWKLGIGSIEKGAITKVKKLTARKNYEYCAKYSPDGSKIIYQEFNWSDRSSDLFIIDKEGGNPTLFFENNISDQNLDWTRDSKSIVFTHIKNDRLGIYIKSLGDNDFREISNSSANNFAPSTSKAEDKIAFLSDRTGKIDLFTMDLAGDNLKNLTPNLKTVDADGNNIWAYKISWSPDGKKLVFNAMINGNLELFIVNADGSDLLQITDNNDSDITPFWMNSNFK